MKLPEQTAEEILNLDLSVNAEDVQDKLGDFVRGTVEDALNAMLDAQADELCGAKRYERSDQRKDTRAGSYERKLHTKAGMVNLKMPKLRRLSFETDIIERYQRRESSVEEALIEMYIAGVSVRRVEDITQALWGERVSSSTISDLNKKLSGTIEEWRCRPIEGTFPYVYADGIWMNMAWGGQMERVAILVVIGVNGNGFREILGIYEGGREDEASWLACLRDLKKRGLQAPRLLISDKCLGLIEAAGTVFPESKWQRCLWHFKRNVHHATPKRHQKTVERELKAIYAQESREEAIRKADRVIERLRERKLTKAADCLANGLLESMTYYDFPEEHWIRIRTNNPLERLNKEIRRRTRVVGAFPDSQSALHLIAARLRHYASTSWGAKRYLNIDHLTSLLRDQEAA